MTEFIFWFVILIVCLVFDVLRIKSVVDQLRATISILFDTLEFVYAFFVWAVLDRSQTQLKEVRKSVGKSVEHIASCSVLVSLAFSVPVLFGLWNAGDPIGAILGAAIIFLIYLSILSLFVTVNRKALLEKSGYRI